MQIDQMKVGHSVDIFITREGYSYRLGSKIEEVKANIVYITLITSKSRVFHFHKDDEIVVIYKSDNRLFRWENARGGTAMLDGDMVHCLQLFGEGKPYNRRDSFRVTLEETAVFERFVMKEDVTGEDIQKALEAKKKLQEEMKSEDVQLLPEEDPRYEKKEFTAFIKDLSESGVGIYTNEKLEKGEGVSFEIFSTYGKMRFDAEVQRQAEERKDAFRTFYGCSFTKLDKNLTKYLYDLQRIQLKKMKGKL